MTGTTRRVLEILLADPNQERYGLELSKQAGIAHGTMYGILLRLEDWGWLQNRLVYESGLAAPPRRYYRLTDRGAQQARATLDAASRRRSSVPGFRAAPGETT